MKVLNVGLDSSILDKNSNLAHRAVKYGALVDRYTIVVPANREQVVDLSDNSQVIAISGKCKIFAFLKIYQISKNNLNHEKYDLITVQDQYYLALLCWFLAKKFRIGLEIQVHGIEKYSGLRKVIAHYVLPKADAVRTVSGRLKDRLLNMFGINETKITVVPVYVNTKNVITKQSYQLKEKIILLTVCRLVPVKNIVMQLQTIANLLKDNLPIELWIVGDGPEKEDLQAVVKNLKIENQVKFWGWQKNPEDFYNQADIFLLTSYSEGWPLVIVESAQRGLPIIMTDVGSAGELVINDVSGLVVPIGDVDALTKALKNLINDEKLREKLGTTVKEKANELLSWEKTLELYKLSWDKAVANAQKKYANKN
jgi:glycosyltransferase involved in cell wall biosynthesis